MVIARDRVVRFHYTLCDESGLALESSRDAAPVAVVHGRSSVLPGIAEALEGRSAGERFRVTLPPEKAYGARRGARTETVPRRRLRDSSRLQPGDPVVIRTLDGPREVTVRAVRRNHVDVDLDHPLAGHTLVFDIEVVEVRAATADEIARGTVARG